MSSLLAIGTPAGGMIGAALVIVILPLTGWRGAFYLCGLLTVVLGLGLFIFLRESPSYLLSKGRVDEARATLSRHLGLELDPVANQIEQVRLRDGGISIFHRSLTRLNLGIGFGFFGTASVSYGLLAWTPIMLTSQGFPLNQALLAVLVFNLVSVGAAILAGLIMARTGSRIVLLISSFALSASAVLLSIVLGFAGGNPGPYVIQQVCFLTGCAGGFAGAATAAYYANMATSYPSECKASGLGFGMMVGRIGGVVGSYAGGILLDLGKGSTWIFLGALAIAALAGVASAAINNRQIPTSSVKSRKNAGHASSRLR